MTDIADKIYVATGLTLNVQDAAKIGHMIRLARQEAADEIEKLREALSRAKKLFLQDEPQKAFIELCAALGEKE